MGLKEVLGEELYNQVIEKAGDNKIAIVSDGNWFPKEKFDAKNQEVKDLNEQIQARDQQLAELEKVDADALEQRIKELQKENENTANEYQTKLEEQAFNYTLDGALTSAKVKNPKAVKALLDIESIKLDGEKLLGLDDQLETLKETESYLFADESEEEKPSFSTGSHGAEGGTDSFVDTLLGK